MLSGSFGLLSPQNKVLYIWIHGLSVQVAMHLVTVFVVILAILMVHAGVDEVRESKKLGLLSIIGHSRKNGRICHSSADSLLFRTNKTTSTQTKNIFGNDNRMPMNSTDYPWRAIGKLSMGCTGALVVSS
jgi:hypothetical protein